MTLKNVKLVKDGLDGCWLLYFSCFWHWAREYCETRKPENEITASFTLIIIETSSMLTTTRTMRNIYIIFFVYRLAFAFLWFIQDRSIMLQQQKIPAKKKKTVQTNPITMMDLIYIIGINKPERKEGRKNYSCKCQNAHKATYKYACVMREEKFFKGIKHPQTYYFCLTHF